MNRKRTILFFLITGLGLNLLLAQEKTTVITEHDLDGDGVKDVISFDYSHGAHCCYTIYIRISSSKREYHYPFQIDGGYGMAINESEPTHFSIKDFDRDGKPEIFMEIATYNGRPKAIPENWVTKYGVSSNYILFDFKDSLRIINEPWVVDPVYYFKVKEVDPGKIKLTPYKEGSKYGFKDESGSVVFEPQWEQVGEFQNNVAMVRHFQRTWLISNKGVILKELNHLYVLDNFMSASGIFRLFDGMKGYYYMNSEGNLMNKEPLKNAKSFSEKLAAVMDNESGLWGYVDPQLNWIILPEYTYAAPFKYGKALVKKEGMDGFFIDNSGRVVKTGNREE